MRRIIFRTDRIGTLILLVFLGLVLAPAGTLRAKEEPVRIGFVGDFTDVSRPYTENMSVAMRMAVDEFNAAGGVGGREVTLVTRDGGNDPARHAACVRELAGEERVAAVFGGASSPAVLAASAACLAEKIPYLVSIGNSQEIVVERGHPYVFQFQPTVSMETKAFSMFATLMPWRRYAWVGPDYSWGHEVFDNFKRQFREIGASLQWTAEAWHPIGAADFSALIERIRTGRPDALVIATYGEDVRRFIEQADAAGLFKTLPVFGWFTYDMTGELGRLVPAGMWSLARGGPFNYLAEKYPRAARFTEEFNRRSGSYPGGYTIACYDSLLAWREAVRRAGTAEPQAVARALKGLRFTGLRGESFIRPVDGQMDCPTYFGRLVYQPRYRFAVWDSVVEIPAAKTWLSEEEVLKARGRRP
jgi:branched-chain amino acid transport system substrate-binding protein